MSPWKIVLLIAALAGLLWFLALQRAIVPNVFFAQRYSLRGVTLTGMKG